MTETELIRYWAYLCESEDRLDYNQFIMLNEGWKRPSEVEKLRIGEVIQKLLDKVLTDKSDDGNIIKLAQLSNTLLKKPEQFTSKYSVCDVHEKKKPYDIVVQCLDGNIITEGRIEDKSTEQSSMFEKSLRFKTRRKSGKISGVNFESVSLEDFNAESDMQNWISMYSQVTSDIKRQLNRRFRELIDDYDYRIQKNGVPSNAKMISFGDDTGLGFVSQVMDKSIRHIGSLTEPFDFPIGMLCSHFQHTHYLHIGSWFYKFSENNPLNLVNEDDSEIKTVQDVFEKAKATFEIEKRKRRYSLVLHVYNLSRIGDDLDHIKIRNGTEKKNIPESENDLGTMTLDDLVHS